MRWALAVVAFSALGAQDAPPTPPPPAPPAPAPAPCSAPEFRQFDFWIGEWEVTANGSVAGTNDIRRVLDGCALHESWKGAGGMSGNSLNAYDATAGEWHQTWVDDRGSVLRLSGAFKDGKMVLSGRRPVPGSPGVTAAHRITWQETAPRQVRQLWEVSRDGGSTWQVMFDGLYRPRRAS